MLSLSDADKGVPPKLWSTQGFEDDPFAGLDEEQLRTVLIAGSEILNRALLGPRVQSDTSGYVRQWAITCDGASVDELLNRFAANAGYDVNWASGANKAGIRERTVWLHLPEASDEQVASVIAGCVGLMAKLENNHDYTFTIRRNMIMPLSRLLCWGPKPFRSGVSFCWRFTRIDISRTSILH